MSKVYSNKALPPGTVLREWRLEQVLGVGGFGIVYKGRGIYFDELVAIKEYFPSAISDRKDGDTVVPNDSNAEEVHALGLKKFVEEAKLLWNLSKPTRHPNIVSVRSLFEINGTAYMVMDFEDGQPLSDLLKKRRKFSEDELMKLVQPISEGLDRAHRVGVLHRDIKPPNILISEGNRPVLIDFGSARFDTAEATSTKVTFHTPPYAAIEQYVKTYEQGPWTDIYALGVVLYECVTGTKPAEVLERMHGGLDHPLAEGDWPDFSRAFLRAIDAAMTIRPTDRPQSIPQWLALFDDENAPFGATADDGEATRFAAYESVEIVPVVPTPTLSTSGAAVVKLTEPPAEAEEDEKPAADAAVAKAAKKLKGKKEPEKPQPKRSWTKQQIAPVASVDISRVDSLAPAIASLAGLARAAGRGGDAGRLAATSARLNALAAEAKAAAAQPGNEAAVNAKLGQMSALARSGAASLAQGVRRDAEAKAKSLAGLSGSDAASARNALGAIRSSASAASAAGNPGQAIDAARRSLAASRQFAAVFPKVQASILPKKREEFAALATSAKSVGQQVLDMGKAKKPGLFASGKRREDYRLRQSNATAAQAELSKLEQLSAAIGAVTTPTAADSAIKQAKAIQAKLHELQTSSAAAMPGADETKPQ
jgi:non-specific serine/threonine protein kinase